MWIFYLKCWKHHRMWHLLRFKIHTSPSFLKILLENVNTILSCGSISSITLHTTCFIASLTHVFGFSLSGNELILKTKEPPVNQNFATILVKLLTTNFFSYYSIILHHSGHDTSQQLADSPSTVWPYDVQQTV